MSDLETRVREALRADEIGWDDLRQPTLRVVSRRPRRWPTVLATAAAAVVVAGVAVAIALTRNGSTGPAAAAPAYAGYTWRVTAVADRRGPIPDVTSVPARIGFSDTEVSGTVAGASIFGHYQPTSQGYEVSHVGFADAGLVASGTKERIGSALLHVFLSPSGGSAPSLSHRVAVTARVHGDRLALRANGVTLRLSRVGAARISPMIAALGYRWRVEAITDEHGSLMIPHRLTATFGFDSYGTMFAKDSVNRLAAMFGLSDDGYVVRLRAGGTAAGYAGHDPTVLRLKAAVDAMVAKQAAVTATVDGDTLTLSRGAITLTLHRGAALPDQIVTGSGAASGAATSAPPTSAASAPPASRRNSTASAPPASRRNSTANSPVRHAHAAGGSHH